jgi:hypothetical protein
MPNPITCVLLATYTNENGDRMEWVLPEMSDPEVELVEAFLRHSYPSGDSAVSVVNIEEVAAFAASFDGDFEEFLAGTWRR